MIEAKRILTVVALAAGVTGLAAPAAGAAPAEGPVPLSVTGTLDDLATSGIPAERRDEVPSVSGQLGKLNELSQLTDQAAPVTNLVNS